MSERTSNMTEIHSFLRVSRQGFREVFQPSRIVLGVFNDRSNGRPNIITLCFDMHCSYKDPMMAFAISKGSLTYSLLSDANECVLAVPGEHLAEAAMTCGTKSGRDVDKFEVTALTPARSEHVSVPSIRECIANIELTVEHQLPVGDHMLVVGRVLKYGVDPTNTQRCLLSVGPQHAGYQVLIQKGIHRIAVVDSSSPSGV